MFIAHSRSQLCSGRRERLHVDRMMHMHSCKYMALCEGLLENIRELQSSIAQLGDMLKRIETIKVPVFRYMHLCMA